MTDARTASETYFDAWRAKDFDRLRSVLADEVTFRGPMGMADGVEECLDGLRGMATHLEDIVVKHRWVDGDDVITWFELHMRGAVPCPTANWQHVDDGKIVSVRVTFDPRPLLGG